MGALHFLVIDDDTLVQRALATVFRQYGQCRAAETVQDAKRELDNAWDGIVVDVRLRDGSGLDVLEEARKRRVKAPAVVLSGRVDHEIVNRTALLDARLVSKPCGTPELAPFISDAWMFKTGDRVGAAIKRARHRWLLTERELEILDGALRNKTREDNIGELGIAANTYKTHVRKLLEKTDYSNLSSLAIDLLSER